MVTKFRDNPLTWELTDSVTGPLALHTKRNARRPLPNTNSYPTFLPTRTLYQLVPYTNSYHIPNTCMRVVIERPRQGRPRFSACSRRLHPWSVAVRLPNIYIRTLPYLRQIPTRTIYLPSVNTLLVPWGWSLHAHTIYLTHCRAIGGRTSLFPDNV